MRPQGGQGWPPVGGQALLWGGLCQAESQAGTADTDQGPSQSVPGHHLESDTLQLAPRPGLCPLRGPARLQACYLLTHQRHGSQPQACSLRLRLAFCPLLSSHLLRPLGVQPQSLTKHHVRTAIY